jgi:predicted transcriptional regulator
VILRLPADLEQRLDREAELSGRTRSDVICEAVSQFIARRERERFMAEYVAEATEGYSDPVRRREAIEIAEEALPLDNECLDRIDAPTPGQLWSEESADKWWA